MFYPARTVNAGVTGSPAECCNPAINPSGWVPLFVKALSFQANNLPGIAACNDGTVGDLNGDGLADVVLTAYLDVTGAGPPTTSQAWVFLTQDGGLVGPAVYTAALPGENWPGYVTLGDLNRDGLLDMVVSTSSTLDVYLNQGTGTFGAEHSIPACRGGQVHIADVNADGWPDIVESCGAFQVFLNDATGNGGFLPGFSLQAGGGDFVLGDFNGDALTDLAYSSGNGLAWLPGGDGGFGESLPLNGKTGASSLATFTTTEGVGFVAALEDSTTAAFNESAGGPSGPRVYLDSQGDSVIATGDLNGDGLPDIVSGQNQAVDVFINDGLSSGANSFLPAQTASVPGAAYIQRIALGDVNGDGATDLIIFWGDGPMDVWANNCP